MESTSVVPHDQITHLLPRNRNHKLVLRGVVVKVLQLLPSYITLETFNVVTVRRNKQVHPPAGLMELGDFVLAHRVLRRLKLCKEFRASLFAGIPERVSGDVILRKEFLLPPLGKLIPCRTRVGKVSVAARFQWRDLVGQEDGVTCSLGVEAAVDMEERVALLKHQRWCFRVLTLVRYQSGETYLADLSPWILRADDVAVGVNITLVRQLGQTHPRRRASVFVALELAEEAGEGDVAFVV